MDIRAAVVREKGRFALETVDLDAPREGEVRVRIVATGMCHTDLAALAQYLPYPLPAVLGHEGAGIVEALGPGVQKLAVGDHVVLSYAFCGHCAACLRGQPAYCADSRKMNMAPCRADGSCTHRAHVAGGGPLSARFFGQSSFATHTLVQERHAVRVPTDLSLATLAPLGCGVQTGAGGVLNVLRPAAGSSIAVFGLGAVGLSAVMAAKLVGCTRIVAVDLHASRLDLAAGFGATDLVLADKTPGAPKVQALVPGGVDYAIEATGVPAVMADAVAATHRTGHSLMLGLPPPGARVDLDAALLLGGRTIRASIEGDSVAESFIPQLIALHRAGLMPFDRLCRLYPLEAINEAVADCRSGATVKPVITMPA